MSRRTRPRQRAGLKPSLRQRARLFVPLRSWRLQLVGAVLAISAAVLSAQSFASAREGASTYQIQPGDTLSAIATTTGVPVDRLITINSLGNPNFIVAGQTLSLDGQAAAPQPAPGQSTGPQYTVQSGDTLWDISQATGVSVDSLASINSLGDANQLRVGQTLRLPPTAHTVQHAALTQAAKPATQPTPAAGAVQTAASAAANPLLQRVASEAARVAGPNAHVGVAATNLVTGQKVVWHADDTFPSASVMKLPILVELERQIAAGTLSWTESLRAEAGAMIAVSDNSAANQIADAIHPQSVNDTMAKIGLNNTRFANLFTDARGPTNPGMNQTSPANMARLLELIATDQIVSPQVSADMRSLLARNTDRSKLVRLLPADASVAHKSGWYDGVANDVGIVSVNRVPARWVIAVFSENLPDAETGNQLVAAVSRAIYDAWAP